QEFAAHAAVPIINGLSDYSHPCQALGDLLTMQELFGKVRGRTLVFVGDGNNVARSVAVCCGKVGVRFVLASPQGYGFDEPFRSKFRERLPGAEIVESHDPAQAVRD